MFVEQKSTVTEITQSQKSCLYSKQKQTKTPLTRQEITRTGRKIWTDFCVLNVWFLAQIENKNKTHSLTDRETNRQTESKPCVARTSFGICQIKTCTLNTHEPYAYAHEVDNHCLIKKCLKQNRTYWTFYRTTRKMKSMDIVIRMQRTENAKLGTRNW